MDLLLSLLQNEAIMGALAVILAYIIVKYVIPKLLENPVQKARLKLILSKFDDTFDWIEQHAQELGITKYQKLAKLMDMITEELAKQIGGEKVLTPDEQAMVAKLAAEKAKN